MSEHPDVKEEKVTLKQKLKQIRTWKPNNDSEWDELFQEMKNASDRAVVLTIGPFVEAAAELAIACRIAEDNFEELVARADAPLGTFSAKIRMLQGLGIIGPRHRKVMDTIREIRNTFAHSMKPIDFNTSVVRDYCHTLEEWEIDAFDTSQLSPARKKFTCAAVVMAQHFVTYSFDNGGKVMETHLD
jgi:Domain of unknown function (DUF4145)